MPFLTPTTPNGNISTYNYYYNCTLVSFILNRQKKIKFFSLNIWITMNNIPDQFTCNLDQIYICKLQIDEKKKEIMINK